MRHCGGEDVGEHGVEQAAGIRRRRWELVAGDDEGDGGLRRKEAARGLAPGDCSERRVILV